MKHALNRIIAATAAVFLTLGVTSAAYGADDVGKLKIAGLISQNSLPSVTSPRTVTGIVPLVTGSGGQIYAHADQVITPAGGASGTFTTGFSSTYTSGGSLTQWFNIGGSSYARWLGTTPYNADQVGMSDSFWVSALSVSISFPASAGYSVSNDKVTLSNTIPNNWHNEHNYSNINFSSSLMWSGPYESAMGSVTFGATTTYDPIN